MTPAETISASTADSRHASDNIDPDDIDSSNGFAAFTSDAAQHSASDSAGSLNDWKDRLVRIRSLTDRITSPLATEDTIPQSMPDASPIRWHLAHTTWFFETFLLKRWDRYRPIDERFEIIFNSYYDGVGQPLPRDQRGLVTRPTLDEVKHYRRHVDAELIRYLDELGQTQNDQTQNDPMLRETLGVLDIGLHHEQQHQELMLTDVKHLFSLSPLSPVYDSNRLENTPPSDPSRWLAFDGGLREVGARSDAEFCFDNELPRHQVYVAPFEMRHDLVTVGEFMEFIRDGGYRTPQHWLSLGWGWVHSTAASAPLYWRQIDGVWHHHTLAGLVPLDEHSVLTHVNYFEADAFARWRGCRLPTESEWEIAAEGRPVEGGFCDVLLDRGVTVHPSIVSPQATESAEADHPVWPGLFGTVWQWTSSPYSPYPGYRPAEGTLGEYNGKFMCNQFVLRGGSCATPSGHVRPTYRNFFPPQSQWQFTGIRLAR